MVNRKKRLEKGIDSLDKQIFLHKEKLKQGSEEEKIELVDYYKKELESLEQAKELKEKQLEKI